jgi:DNA polymerase-3 subunit epsilon
LENSAESITKLYAVNAPYDKKDLLKQRGYRWSDGSNGTPKCWWISIPEAREKNELAYLAAEIYSNGRTDSVEMQQVRPIDRFSVREG